MPIHKKKKKKKKVLDTASREYKRKKARKAAASWGTITGQAQGSSVYAISSKVGKRKTSPIGLVGSALIGGLWGRHKAIKKHNKLWDDDAPKKKKKKKKK